MPTSSLKTYFIVFELQRVLVYAQTVSDFKNMGLVHVPSDCCFDEVSVTLVGKSDRVRVRTNFVPFWSKMCELDNVFPIIWSDMPYERVRDICSFLFQECSKKPGIVLSRYDMKSMRDSSGYFHRRPLDVGSLKKHGDIYMLKDLKDTMWDKTYTWKSTPRPPVDVYPDSRNTLLIDPNQESNITSPDNVLYPTPWYSPVDRHSCLERNLFPIIHELAQSGENVRSFMKKHRHMVPGVDPLDKKSHVREEYRKWLLCRN